jgi:hypothetical protein
VEKSVKVNYNGIPHIYDNAIQVVRPICKKLQDALRGDYTCSISTAPIMCDFPGRRRDYNVLVKSNDGKEAWILFKGRDPVPVAEVKKGDRIMQYWSADMVEGESPGWYEATILNIYKNKKLVKLDYGTTTAKESLPLRGWNPDGRRKPKGGDWYKLD